MNAARVNRALCLALTVVAGCTTRSTSALPAGASPPEPASAPVDAGGGEASVAAPTSTGATPATGAFAESVLFVDAPGQAKEREQACPRDLEATARTLCLVDLRYAGDPESRSLAHALYRDEGILAGLEPPHSETMGFRGTIHFVPELPVGRYRQHLAWVSAAVRDIDALFRELDADAAKTAAPAHRRYQVHPFVLHFTRTVGRTTPSAYAEPDRWEVTYNVAGSLNTSADAVRELLFHELFHRNDRDDADFSVRALSPLYRTIRARCGGRLPCLAAYTPTTTRVRGGTYYAFQPEEYDPVLEYAAELALRWYREQRAVLRGERVKAPFKCGPRENAEAWRLIVDEFFAGRDRVPACLGVDSAADGGTLPP